MDRSAQLFRLLKIITEVQAYPGRLTVKNLVERLEFSERTIYRDLATLNAAGVPITYDRHTEGYRLLPGFFLPPVNITLPELLSLSIAAETLSASPFQRTMADIVDKLLNGISSENRLALRRFTKKFAVQMSKPTQSAEQREIFATLNEAIINNRRVAVCYCAPGAKPTKRQIDPYGLAFRNSAWYLVGLCHLRNEVRTFRVNRFREVVLRPERFTVPGDFSMADYFGGSWGAFRDKSVRIRVKFDKEVARFFKETKYHPTQKITTQPDGSIIFEAEAGGFDEISSWILSWGEFAEVLEPKELREMVMERTRGTIEKYNSN